MRVNSEYKIKVRKVTLIKNRGKEQVKIFKKLRKVYETYNEEKE